MNREHYRIRGRVQGVGFRYWVVRHATALGLRGWVCNRADGAVEVEAAGDVEALAKLRALLAEGPRHARVDAVDELPVTARALPEHFEMVH